MNECERRKVSLHSYINVNRYIWGMNEMNPE